MLFDGHGLAADIVWHLMIMRVLGLRTIIACLTRFDPASGHNNRNITPQFKKNSAEEPAVSMIYCRKRSNGG